MIEGLMIDDLKGSRQSSIVQPQIVNLLAREISLTQDPFKQNLKSKIPKLFLACIVRQITGDLKNARCRLTFPPPP
jgi:hypothetical protein